jgi:hypothetical protein
MALEVASILDEFIVKPEWLEKSTHALNSSLSSVKVSPGYNIMVTIAGRSYVVTSDANGQLAVSVVPNYAHCIAKALARANCRITVDPAALKQMDEQNVDWSKQMAQTRKMQYTGNIVSLDGLQRELGPHIARLRQTVDAAGPGAAVVQRAIEEFNSQLEANELTLADELVPNLDIFAPEDGDNTLLMYIRSWLLFSAPTSFSGNMGQSNYCAANNLLDAQSFSTRQTNSLNFEAITMMWGAVAGLGMRWKAFASQDMLGTDQLKHLLMDHTMAQNGLRYLLIPGNPPEWTTIALGYEEQVKAMQGNWPRDPDPWRFSKGKGGGSFDSSSLNFHRARDNAKEVSGMEADGHSADKSWLFPGRRVRLQGLQLHAEMNGLKGTLVEEVHSGVWHVQLDDGSGEKLIKVGNMVQIHTSVVPEKKTATPQSQQQLCLGGNWDDWTPHNMHWDEQLQCHAFDVNINGVSKPQFSIARGQAGTRKWKPGALKKWSMGTAAGMHKIKVFVVDSKIGNVEWEPRSA